MALFLMICFALALNFACAEPLRYRDVKGIPQTQLDQFELLAQYSAAAYCYNNIQGRSPTVTCTSEGGYCPTVENHQPVVVGSFFNIGITKTAGYVAVDQINQLIVVAIQGTSVDSNPIDALTDLEIERDYTSLCGTANAIDGCLIHHGFWQASNDVMQIVTTNINAALALHPSFQVITTGHSLGAAVAALLGAQLRNNGFIVDMYTFGQPSLGAADVSNYIQNQAPSQGNNYRITHYNDVVPQLPEHSWGGWDHYYPEFWISKKTGIVATSDMLVVTGSLYETSGNEGQRSKFGILGDLIEGLPAHDLYFGAIDGCDSNKPSAGVTRRRE